MSDPARQVEDLRAQFEREIAAAAAEPELRVVRDRYLSRKGGLVSALLKALGAAPPRNGRDLASSRISSNRDIEARLTTALEHAERSRRPKGAVDVTLPGRRPAIGHRHPLTILREQVEAIFSRFGFLVIEGPELEDDYHNFEALNMPPEHPARDMQDTLYLAEPLRSSAGSPATPLRTHTSGMQIRAGEVSAAGAADRPAAPTAGRFRP
jgi:phenylalanyl-tRNA synthetase alpha chain